MCVCVSDLFSITFTMKTTVSVALFMILTAFQCSSQHIFWRPVQQVWSFQSEQNGGLLPSSSLNSPGTFSESNIQNQRGQPQRVSSNNAASNPSHNSAQPWPKASTGMVWQTPDSWSTEATTAGTSMHPRPFNNPSTTASQSAGSRVSSSSSGWPTKKASSIAAFVSAAAPQRKPPGPRPPGPRPQASRPQQFELSTATPVASEDKVVFEPPGGNRPGSMYNSLDSADAIPDKGSEINNGLRQFALDLLLDTTERTPNKNVVLSPYSIWAVMLVIFEGAEGESASQIANSLHFKGKKQKVRVNYKRLESALRKAHAESRSDFVSGNGIFFDLMRPPLPEFQNFAQSAYQCHLEGINFSNTQLAVKTINDWVANVTQKRIKMLVKPEDVMRPELIITNALFFKGQWEIPFNLSATHLDKFYNEQKQFVANVPMMYQKGKYLYSYINEIGAHVLDMPYTDKAFRMLVVLPKPSSNVSEVLRQMKQFPVDQCYDRLVHEQEMFSEDEVHVYLPKFKFGNRMELKSNLQRLGIKDVFDSTRANLSSMSTLNLFLGKVFHVSEIEVNEEGTIASAATGAGFVNKMGPPKFLANRPFAYFIVENSQKTVIFAGKVVDPTRKS